MAAPPFIQDHQRAPDEPVFAAAVNVGACDLRQQIEALVYQSIVRIGGSISAEHGIGMEKKKSLGYSRSDVEIDLMRTLKQAIDPQGLFNRDRIFDMRA